MIRPLSPTRRLAPVLRLRMRRTAVAAAAVTGLLLGPVVGLGQAAATGSTTADAYRSINSTRHPDWMSLVNGDTWLAAMTIPGTHETMAIQDGGPVQTQEDYGVAGASLANQLERGIRAIDVRVRVIGDSFTIHHGAYYQDAVFDDVLTKARDFLTAHKGETILMRLHSECTGEGLSCTDSPSTTTQGDRERIFERYANSPEYKDSFYRPSVTKDAPTGVPRLRDVRGKIVLTNFEGPRGGDYGYGIKNYNDNREDHFDASPESKRWNYAKANLDKAAVDTSGKMFTTYTSGAYAVDRPMPYQYAQSVNPELMKYLNNSGGNGDHLGVVMTDFPGWALIDNLIYRNPSQIWSAGKDSSGRTVCLDDYQNNFTAGGKVTTWVCNQGVSQQWTLIGKTLQMGAVSQARGVLCLDIAGFGTANNSVVQLWGCNGGANQQWALNSKSQLVNPNSGRCLDIPAGMTGGPQLIIYDCTDGAKNQIWYHA